MPTPWRLVVDLSRMGGELVGNARRLLRIVHGIGGESRHSGREEGGKEEKEERRERLGKQGKKGEVVGMVVVVVKNSERGAFVAVEDDEHSYGAPG